MSIEPEGFAIEPDTLIPERMPELFASTPLLVLGRFGAIAVGRLAVRARDSGGAAWSELVEGRPRENPAIATAWARGQVRKLEDRYLTATSQNLGDLEKHIVSVSLRFGVLCRFTAYIAIDRSAVVNTTSKLHRITQPVESPEGWAMSPPQRRTVSSTKYCARRGRVCRKASRFRPRRSHRLTWHRNPRQQDVSVAGSLPREVASATPPSPGHPAPDGTEELLDLLESIEAGLPDRFINPTLIGKGSFGSIFVSFDRNRNDSVCVETLQLSSDQAVKLPFAGARFCPA